MAKAVRKAGKRGSSSSNNNNSKKLRAGKHTSPIPVQLPDPKRPDLVGLKPAMVKKLRRKHAFLKSVGAGGQAAANAMRTTRRRKGGAGAEDTTDADFSVGLADLGAMLEATTGAARSEAVATKEVERLKTVLSHPAYQRDPHAALREHLKATLGSSDRGSSRPRSQGQGHSQLQRQQRPS